MIMYQVKLRSLFSDTESQNQFLLQDWLFFGRYIIDTESQNLQNDVIFCGMKCNLRETKK